MDFARNKYFALNNKFKCFTAITINYQVCNFWILCKTWKFTFEDLSYNNENLLSSDTLYNIARSCSWDNTLQAKIEKIESLWYDMAGWRTLANEIFPNV